MALVMRLSRKLCAIGRHQKHFGLSFRHLSTSSSANVKAVASSPSLSQLEKYIAERQPAQALCLFKRLSSPPSKMISQKLAILLSKKGTKTHANSAFEILRNIYTSSELVPDDYTKLSFIYVVDACLRHKMLDKALEVYEEALNLGIVLDLPAYDGILSALVEEGKIDDAIDILKEISAAKEVSPTERSYMPLLVALINRHDFLDATKLMDHGRSKNVAFSFQSYQQLIEVSENLEDDTEAKDALDAFMHYIDNALSEDGILEGLIDEDEDEDDEDIDVAVEYLDDDDDEENEFDN